jgi:hypothetical protein
MKTSTGYRVIFQRDYRYEMIKCLGCDAISFRRVETMPTFDSDGEDIEGVAYYPPRVARRSPEWLSDHVGWNLTSGEDIPEIIINILTEIYEALHNNSKRLVAMGVRAVLDAIMVDKVGDQGSFTRNLDTLKKADYLSVRQEAILSTILEAGHAAIHRGWQPTDDQISTLLDITESLIESIYIHEPRAERLEKVVPNRRHSEQTCGAASLSRRVPPLTGLRHRARQYLKAAGLSRIMATVSLEYCGCE